MKGKKLVLLHGRKTKVETMSADKRVKGAEILGKQVFLFYLPEYGDPGTLWDSSPLLMADSTLSHRVMETPDWDRCIAGGDVPPIPTPPFGFGTAVSIHKIRLTSRT